MMSNASGSFSVVPEPSHVARNLQSSPSGQLPGATVRPAQRLVSSDKGNDDSTTANGKFPDNCNEKLRDAVEKSNDYQAEQALHSGADPNQSQEFTNDSRAYEGCIVTMAVMRDDIEMVKLLVKNSAALDSRYYEPDESQKEIQKPLAFAARSVEMLKALCELKADLAENEDVSGNQVTLLWNASHDGHNKIVDFLLDRRPEHLEKECAIQVNKCAYTPLHIASSMGHLEVVRVLIQRGAKVEVEVSIDRGEKGKVIQTPLMAAIDQHHAAVVRLLVQKQAAVFSDRVVDLLFKSNYVGTIEAVIDGLRCAKEEDPKDFKNDYLHGVEKHWEKFLKTSSHAMLSMIHLIYQEASLLIQTTYMDGCKGMRLIDHGCIPDSRKANVAEGPDMQHLTNLAWQPEEETLSWRDRIFTFRSHGARKIVQQGRTSKDVQATDEKARIGKLLEIQQVRTSKVVQVTDEKKARIGKLLESLLQKPDLNEDLMSVMAETQKQDPIQIYQCVIPGLHRDPKMFLIMAKQDEDAVFRDPAIQATLQFQIQLMKLKFFWRLISNFCLLGCFLKMSIKVNNNIEVRFELQSFISDFQDGVFIAFLSGIIFYNIVREIMQMAGFRMLGQSGRYWRDFWKQVELGSLVMITTVGYGLLTSYESFVNPEKEAYIGWRALLSVVVFVNWLRVFSVLRVYQFAGTKILPILHGFENILPFLAVTTCPFIGLFHAYYCFGIYKEDVWRTFSIVYRLGILGDFDLEDMEDVDGHYVPETNDGVTQFTYVQPEKGSWWLVLRIFLMACSMILTVSMMNIFIGVLSESYNQARQRSEAIFWKTRADVIVEEVAMEIAHEKLWNLFPWCRQRKCKKCGHWYDSRKGTKCPRCKHRNSLDSSADGNFVDQEDLSENDGWGNYLWYCRRIEGCSAQTNSCKEAATPEDLNRLEENLKSTCDSILQELKRVSATSESETPSARSSKLQEQHTYQVDPDAEGLRVRIRDIGNMLEHGRISGKIHPGLEANVRSMLEQASEHLVKMLDASAFPREPQTKESTKAALTSVVRQAPRKEVPQAQPLASRARHIEPQLIDKLQDVVLGLEKGNACLRQDMVQLEADVNNVKGQSNLLVEIAKDKIEATQLPS